MAIVIVPVSGAPQGWIVPENSMDGWIFEKGYDYGFTITKESSENYYSMILSFIDQYGDKTWIRSGHYLGNEEGTRNVYSFIVPDLPSGEYTMEVAFQGRSYIWDGYLGEYKPWGPREQVFKDRYSVEIKDNPNVYYGLGSEAEDQSIIALEAKDPAKKMAGER